MALLFVDGFDHYDPQQLDSSGQPLLARGKAAYLSPQATRIPGRRPSSYALRLPEGSGGGYVKNLDQTKTSLIVGAAVRTMAASNTGSEPVLLGVRDTTSQVSHIVRVTDDGRLKLYRRQSSSEIYLAISTAAATARVWHYVELQIIQGTSTGVLIVRLNGIQAIYLTGQNTISSGGQLLTVFLGAIPGQSCPRTIDVDDLYIADTSGTINNDFLGDVRVDALPAQADGSLTQWTIEGSAPTAWQAVSDNDDTTGVRAASSGLRQSFDIASLPAMATPSVHGVQVTMLARKTDAGSGKVKGLVKSGASISVSADLILQEQLAWHTALFQQDPNGNVQWTESTFNSAEFGVESA